MGVGATEMAFVSVLLASVLPIRDQVGSLSDQLITQVFHSANQNFPSFLYLSQTDRGFQSRYKSLGKPLNFL